MKVIQLHQTEKDLISQAIAGNRSAQHQLYNQFAPKMLAVCRQYLKDVQLSEDIMITAFMKVFTNLKSYQHNGSFEGWIRRIMVNESISHLRVQKQTKFVEDENFAEESYSATDQQFAGWL